MKNSRRRFWQTRANSRGRISTTLISVIALSLTAAILGPAPVSATTRAAAPASEQTEAEPPPTPPPPPPPALEANPQWDYFSAAYLSPTTDPQSRDQLTNAANAQGLLEVKIRRPQPDTAERHTELRIFSGGQLERDGTQLMGVGDPFAGKYELARESLDTICRAGTILPDDPVGQASVSCQLDPAKWGKETDAAAKKTNDTRRPPTAQQAADSGQTGSGSSKDGQKAVLIALGAVLGDNEDSTGSSRAANLDAWLHGLAGSELGDEAAKDVDLAIPHAVELVEKTLDRATNTVQENVISSVDLRWKQCFRAAEDNALRATCRPNSSFGMVFADPGNQPSDSGSVPTDTSANLNWGTLVPGKAWNGELTFTNQSQLRGWSGPSPFTGGVGSAPNPLPGYTTQYVVTELAPRSVDNVEVSLPELDATSRADCRQTKLPTANQPTDQVRRDFPDELQAAGTLCPLSETEFVQPMLSPESSDAGAPQWDTADGVPGRFGFDVSYNVPLDYLKSAANDSNWKEVTHEVEQIAYNDEAGNPLPKPEVRKVPVSYYESTVTPSAWAWVPKDCVNRPNLAVGDVVPVVCAGGAAPNPTADGTVLPPNLELVKVAKADNFVRRICSLCWPAPQTLAASWSSPDDVKDKDTRIENNSSIMQGQHGYLAITAMNASQTPGFWGQSKLVFDNVPDDVGITPDRVAVLPTDGASARWPNARIDDLKGLSPNAISCTRTPEQKSQVICTITDNKADLKMLGLPELFNPGSYAFMFRVNPGLNAPVLADDLSHSLTAHLEYPSFKEGQAAFGADDTVEAQFKVIPESEAVVGLVASQPNLDYSKSDPASPLWSEYSGSPLEIAVTNPADASSLAKQTLQLHYDVANQGPRWIRANDQFKLNLTLPPDVVPGQEQTNYDEGHASSPELAAYGETWGCDKTKTTQESSEFGFQFTWDVWQVGCAATVSDKRTDGGLMATGSGGRKGKTTEFPGLVLPLTGAVESPTSEEIAAAEVKVYRPKDGELREISGPNPNAASNVPIRIVDPSASVPTVQPYWLARPVAGGHATARIDVANINRGSAAGMNLLLAFEQGTYVSAKGTNWSCQRITDQRASCHYDGGLAKHEGDPLKNPNFDRTTPLMVQSEIPEDASGTYRMSTMATIFNVRPDQASGAIDGGLTYEVGKQINPVATTLSNDAVSETLTIDSAGTTPALPINFEGDITQPTSTATKIQLDASQSTGPFAGQAINARWRQVCVIGEAQATDEACGGTQPAPRVTFVTSQDILNPAFVPPQGIAETTRFRFEVEASDQLEPTQSIPAPTQLKDKTGQLLPVFDPATEVKPNTRTAIVESLVAPRPQTLSSEIKRDAGSVTDDTLIAVPTLVDVTAGDRTVNFGIDDPTSSGEISYEYSSDGGKNWASLAPPTPVGAYVVDTVSESAELKSVSKVGEGAGKTPGKSRKRLINGTEYQIAVRPVTPTATGAASVPVAVTVGEVEKPVAPSPQVPVDPSPQVTEDKTSEPTQAPNPEPTAAEPTQSPTTDPDPSKEPESPEPVPTEPPVQETCQAFLAAAATRGFKVSLGDDQPELTDGECVLAGTTIVVNDWLTLQDAEGRVSANGLTIESANGKFPALWQMSEGALTVTDAIVVPSQVTEPVTGKISGEVLPWDVVLSPFLSEARSTSVVFGSSGAATTTVVSVESIGEGDNPRTLRITGAVGSGGFFKLGVRVDNLIEIGGAQLSLDGVVEYATPDSPVVWSATTKIENFTVSEDPKMILTLDVNLSDKGLVATGHLDVGGGDTPGKIDISGGMQDSVLKLTGKQTGIRWSAFGESPISAEVEVEYNVSSADMAVKLNATAEASVSLSKGLLELRQPTVAINAARKDGNMEVSTTGAGTAVLAGANPANPLTIALAGSVKFEGGKVAFDLCGEQDARDPDAGTCGAPLEDRAAAVSERLGDTGPATPFEITKGVLVSGIAFSLSYGPGTPDPGAPEGTPAPPSATSASFAGTGEVRVPGSDETKNAPTGSIKAEYLPEGLSFDVSATKTGWMIADGIDMSGLEFAYQSFPKDFTPTIEGAGFPTFPNFRGLVALGMVDAQPGSFIQEDLGFRGQDGQGSVLGTYVRIDMAKGSYEGAVTSGSALSVFGNAGDATTSSFAINNPYLRVTYTRADPSAAQTKALTVALGGTGQLRYSAGEEMKTYADLAVSASVDVVSRRFAGKAKFTSPWVDAGGISGLTIKDAAIDLSIGGSGESVSEGSSPGKKGLSASFFAKVAMGEAPAYMADIGLQKDTEMAVGFSLGTNWCAQFSIGEGAQSPKVALKPFAFAGDVLGEVLNVNYASFVYVGKGSQCNIGGQELKVTSMVMRGSILKVLPLELNLIAKPKPGAGNKPAGAIALDSAGEGSAVASAPMGPATLSDAKVKVGIDTSRKPNKSNQKLTVMNSPGLSLKLQGNMPVGKTMLTVGGDVSVVKDKKVRIGLTGSTQATPTDPDKPIAFGKFSIAEAMVAVSLVADPLNGKLDINDGFSMTIGGKAIILKSPFTTKLDVAYAGGNVQSMTGTVDASQGVVVGDHMIIKGGGTVDWSTTSGLMVTIGTDAKPGGRASFAYCTAKTPPGTAACAGGASGGYSFSEALLSVGPRGFSADGTLTIGDTFSGELTGSYYVEDGINASESITLNGANHGLAKAGDFAFGVQNATIKLPNGQTKASIAVGKYHSAQDAEITEGRMGFEIPMLGGRVNFDGTFSSDGLYNIVGGAKGMSIVGFSIDDGCVRVKNFEIASADAAAGNQPHCGEAPNVGERTKIAKTVAVDVQANLLSWSTVRFQGKFGEEDGSVAYRIKGDAIINIGPVDTGATVAYSTFPKDAGMGFAALLEVGPALEKIEIEIGGVFHRDRGDQILYRATGAVTVPIVPGLAAVGTAQVDNCVNASGVACARARTGNDGDEAITQIKVAAGVEIGGGLARAAVEGDIGFDGGFRLVGSARAGVSMGPWGFFGVIEAEAGFSLAFGVCMANRTAANRATPGGCGMDQTKTWVVGLDGSAWSGITMNFGFFKVTIGANARVAGVIYPDRNKFCAIFGAFGFDIQFGTCPTKGEVPDVNPHIDPSDFT